METLLVEAKGPSLNVWFNRPEARNAIDDRIVSELTEVIQTLDSNVRVVVLSGRGSVFSSGTDLSWMRRTADPSESSKNSENMASMFKALDECPIPIIARVNGHAFGASIGFLATADIVIALEHAKFGFGAARLGNVPGVVTPFVVRCIGASAARRYFLTAEHFGAADAKQIGLVHDIVESDPHTLDRVIKELTDAILESGPLAVKESKELISRVANTDLDSAIRDAVSTAARVRFSAEGQTGLEAYLEKRKPPWS